MKEKSTYPALFIALSTITTFGIIAIGHLITHQPLIFLHQVGYSGLDYLDFFQASENIVHGQSPYDIPNNRYVTTPIPAIINMIFVPLGFRFARNIVHVLIPITILVGIFAVVSIYQFTKADRNLILLSGLICVLLGYPFYFLLERGNIDGWVLLFLSSGLFFFKKPKMEWLSGFLIALAIAFKVYPILLFLPIILYRKWRIFFFLTFWLVIFGASAIFWFSDFQNILASRSQSLFSLDDNGSLVATVIWISIFLEAIGILPSNLGKMGFYFSPIISALIYGILISLVIYADIKLNRYHNFEITSLFFYCPFMVALPVYVFHYSFVICLILLPVLSHLWATNTRKYHRFFITFITIGIALTQWQSVALFNLTQNYLAQAIPGLGLLIAMIGISIFKLLNLHSTLNLDYSKTMVNPKNIDHPNSFSESI